jgi:hypothetical protein
MTWDLREQMLLAKWREEGHEFRAMGGGKVGAAMCLRCETIVHVTSRAQAAAGDDDGRTWRDNDPFKVKPCKPWSTMSPS